MVDEQKILRYIACIVINRSKRKDMSSVSKIVRKSRASLFWYFRSLTKAKREAIYTLCAFCFHIEQILNGSLEREQKEDLLKAWKIELDNIYDKKVPETTIGRKIYKNCMRFKIRKEDFAAILDAALLDFENPLRAPSKDVFEAYCHGSSIAPIYIMLKILGELKEASMRALSQNLGRAIELTNILRNIKDDAVNGHLYVPREVLISAQIMSTDPMSVVTNKNLTAVREKLGKEALICFDKAHKLIFTSDRKSTRILRFIYHLYRRYFDIMRLRGWEIISPKPEIKRIDKVKIAFNAMFDRN